MANVTTEINGEEVTLIDNGDGTYRIDLLTSDARRFVRAELTQLRSRKRELLDERDRAEGDWIAAREARDAAIARRDETVAELTDVQANIDELVAWIQSQGDPTE